MYKGEIKKYKGDIKKYKGEKKSLETLMKWKFLYDIGISGACFICTAFL